MVLETPVTSPDHREGLPGAGGGGGGGGTNSSTDVRKEGGRER